MIKIDFIVKQTCDNQEHAHDTIRFMQDVIDTVAKTYGVWIRREPEWSQDKDFERNTVEFNARCHFSVLKDMEPGTRSKVVYGCCENHICGFGLAAKTGDQN